MSTSAPSSNPPPRPAMPMADGADQAKRRETSKVLHLRLSSIEVSCLLTELHLEFSPKGSQNKSMNFYDSRVIFVLNMEVY